MMKNILTQEEKNRIDTICREYKIEIYTINSDGSIDVKGKVDLTLQNLSQLPLKFNKIIGDFWCRNNRLTTLLGSPVEVSGDFLCNKNELISLEGAPVLVGGIFNVSDNLLTSLEHSPKKIGGGLYVMHNELTNLNNVTSEVSTCFNCTNNNLTTVENMPYVKDGYCVFYDNPKLPKILIDTLNKFTDEERKTFFKYQAPFCIWFEGFDEEALLELYNEIKDGLL